MKLLSTKSCPYCPSAKRFLDEKKIKYESVLVERLPQADFKVFTAQGLSTVPSVEENGVVLDFGRWKKSKGYLE